MLRSHCGRSPKVHKSAFVHESAEIIGRVRLSEDASIWPLCVLRGDIEPISVGAGSNIQDLSVVHTRRGFPARIGRHVTVGHRAVIHGARIGDGCLVGMGAVVMEAVIGKGSIVGAGAVVPAGMRVPPGSVLMGLPARVVRKVRPAEARLIAATTRSYLGKAMEHRRGSASGGAA